MKFIDIIGRDNEVFKRIDLDEVLNPDERQYVAGIVIRDASDDDQREHFQDRPSFPAWNSKRKISDLPEPPDEVR